MRDGVEFPPEPPLDCALCPRLVAYREANAAAEPDWHNAPVVSFGDAAARLLVVGLAPGRTGANRTARPFTGDWAGDLLYPTLEKFGFARGRYDKDGDDDLRLVGAMITNAVRCVPPENKPVGAECNRCRPYLASRIDALPRLRVLLTLGKIAHDNTVRALGLKLKDHPFGHAASYAVAGPAGPLTLLSSYHCSRYNTNTGRLTEAMFHDVFAEAKARVG
ncbi:uracil-DNA glycosylase [Marinicauda salina]|uniref:Type-5 uracil-DNA glycosylase n=1 Tax=Marinicauda salina TaxID=2135793 RepID=A0A2U2BVG0_9PROT|nr:uracil-DNA glycosylase [Marinicauda salina]PWE17954.1 uracil-DNA glycosylase [Marinicauda salina]